MTFGEKIQKLRKEAGLSQEELSYQLKVSRQAISKWENDSGYPETEKIIRMSKIFNVTLDYLLNEELAEKENVIETEHGFYVSREMADGFILHQEIKIKKIALAAGLFVASLSLTYSNLEINMLLITIAMIVSIAMLVSARFMDNPYKKLLKKQLVFDSEVLKELSTIYAEKKRKANFLLIVGTVFLAGGFFFAPLLMIYTSEFWNNAVMQVAMVLAGAGLFLCIYVTCIIRSYRTLIKNEI